jgi:inorganic triphosphatase YgiF
MPTEVELKLVGSPRVLAAASRLPWLRTMAIGKTKKQREVASVYFDTPKTARQRNGISLRVRKVGREQLQTVKREGDGAASIFVRDQWEQKIGSDRPEFDPAKDTPAAAILKHKSMNALRPMFETAVQRTLIPLRLGTSEIELAIDRGWVRSGKRRQRIGEIELELKRGNVSDLVEVAAKLADALPVSFEPQSKAERGYALASNERDKPVRAGEIQLNPDETVGEAFRTIAFSCLHHLAANRNAVCKGEPEGIHQMRIGLRRLRAAISAFKNMVAGQETHAIKTELKWLTDRLAPARDFDVLLNEVLLPLHAERPGEPGLEALIADIEGRRDEGVRAAKESLRSERYRKAVLRTALWLADGDWSRSQDPLMAAWRETSVREFAREVLQHRAKKIATRGRELKRLDQDHRHKLRIAVKKLRYSTEFFASLFPSPKAERARKHFEGALKILQTALGEINDIAVHQELARQLTKDTERLKSRPEEAYAMGLVVGREHRRASASLTAAKNASKQFSDAAPFWH